MPAALLVFIGGGLGALFRMLSVQLIGGPLAIVTVNLAGSFAIGLIAAAVPEQAVNVRLFFMTGVLGGFTTFSAFSLDALALWQRGQPATAAAYVLATVVLSLAACAAGWSAGRII